MKKKLTIVIIFVLLYNGIMANFVSFATDGGQTVNFNQIHYEGQADVGTNKTRDGKTIATRAAQKIPSTLNGGAAVATVLCMLFHLIPHTISTLMTWIVNAQDESGEMIPFTIQGTVFGQYSLFDINFFNIEEASNDGSTGGELNNQIKKNIANWYVGVRNLVIVLSLLILVYIGIRMAISTVASQRATYKNMLINWAASFVLIFVLHFFMIIILNLAQAGMDIVSGLLSDSNFEVQIWENMVEAIKQQNGWELVLYEITYWILTFYQLRFFFMYMKRLLSTAFLIVIAPLITVTYSIDKVKDNRAQALGAWFKEFMVNATIQPLHAVLYLLFIGTASELATQAPILALIFFMALSRGEKIVKTVFGMRGLKSINSMSEYLKLGKKH